ncbi:MAG: hypothetical protein V6004_01925 [Candidatus Dasytiphilus stammeri]
MDPISAFGVIIAVNRELNKYTANLMIKNPFVNIIIVPSANKSSCDQTESTNRGYGPLRRIRIGSLKIIPLKAEEQNLDIQEYYALALL